MPHIVRLRKEDQMLLLNLLADSFDYKISRKLRNEDSKRKMSEWYIDAAEQIRDNHIPVNSQRSNLFVWLKDQFSHSGSEIWARPECQRACEICSQASANTYRSGS
jgi:hypothetical protein